MRKFIAAALVAVAALTAASTANAGYWALGPCTYTPYGPVCPPVYVPTCTPYGCG